MVVTPFDHDANIRPWVLAAEAIASIVCWVPFDGATGALHPADVAGAVCERDARAILAAGESEPHAGAPGKLILQDPEAVPAAARVPQRRSSGRRHGYLAVIAGSFHTGDCRETPTPTCEGS